MKFKNIFIVLALLFATTGCEIKQYIPNNNTEVPEAEASPEITAEEISVINDWDYNGTITYAPENQTKLSSEQIYQKGISSTVYILASDDETLSLGSGVVFSEDENDDGYAYIFTNAHVIKGATTIEVVYSNYKRDTASVVGYHLLEDVAVIAVKKNNNYATATLNTSDKLNTATQVLTIGTPISTDFSFSATTGIISKINSPLSSILNENYSLMLLQIDASLNPGNSGGPLFDSYGNLIGLNTMKVLYDENYNDVDDLNFAIPIERAVFMANTFFSQQKYERGLLGITITDIVDLSIETREYNNVTLEHGLLVLEVSSSGACNDVLQEKDIITKINGIDFITKNQFQKILFNFSKNEEVTLTIYRNNEYQDFTITLK